MEDTLPAVQPAAPDVLPDEGAEYNPEQEVVSETSGLEQEDEGVVDVEAKLEDQSEVEETEAEAKSEEDEAEPDAPKPEAKPESRAQKRIVELNRKAKDAESALQAERQQSEQRFLAIQQHLAQQLQAQQSHYEKQLAVQEQQIAMAKAKIEEEAFSKLPPEEQFKAKLYKEWADKAKAEVMPEVEQLKEQLSQERAQREQVFAQARRQNEIKALVSRANAANDQTFAEVMTADESFKAKFSERLEELNLTYATALGEQPEAAAKALHEAFEAYHKAKLRAVSKSKGALKVQENKGMPVVAKGGQVAAEGKINWPTTAQLREDGRFERQTEWLKAGKPVLRKANRI